MRGAYQPTMAKRTIASANLGSITIPSSAERVHTAAVVCHNGGLPPPRDARHPLPSSAGAPPTVSTPIAVRTPIAGRSDQTSRSDS
jgi:hypothetical protein